MNGFLNHLGACTALQPAGSTAYFVAGLLPAFVLFRAILARQPTFFGKRYFMIANWAVIWWIFAVLMELISIDPGCKVAWGTAAFLGIGAVPVAWFLFVYRFTRGESGPVARWQAALLIGVPLAVFALAATNPWHHAFYNPVSVPVSDEPGAPLIYEHRVLYYVAAGGLYCFLLGAYGLLAAAIVRGEGLARLLYSLLFLLAAIPTAANVAYILTGWSIGGFDPTPILFSTVLLIYSALISLNQFFQLTTVAKDVVLENLPDPVLVIGRDGKIMVANARAAEVFGIDMSQEPTVETFPQVARLLALILDAEGGTRSLPEISVNGADYEVRYTSVDGQSRRKDHAIGFALLFSEITNRKSMQMQLATVLLSREEELAQMTRQNRRINDEVRTDPLTGLLNRRALSEEIARLNEDDSFSREPMVATIIDIDHFKSINDRFGHYTGDAALTTLATCLREGFRKEDRIFRLGGEEFLVLSPSIDLSTLYDRIDRLKTTVAQAARVIPGDFELRFSAGVAVSPYDADTLTDLVAAADRRLYEAKSAGRDRTQGPAPCAGAEGEVRYA
ncbi:diguanylate cyclase [Wenxinia marina]|uniref:diguanylate cyclase n=1 Tax=Wenxinia marina DSM 24838 TaxID=1123501 RepID=A0A0D0Q9V4_9RHOB|nr:diguanylate cyclase [Wenxinia marina]KIQ69132.1 diguanylate cyclase (GGDEF) domain protein [Wenxinia marina DSM 24838]GGL70556.1 GGDEF domain-containing protein [Wenxinia marina]